MQKDIAREIQPDLLSTETALTLPQQVLPGITPRARERFTPEIPVDLLTRPTPPLAEEKVASVQEWLRLPTGERIACPLFLITCQKCYDRYYTPGTIYYMNQTLLNQCLANCT